MMVVRQTENDKRLVEMLHVSFTACGITDLVTSIVSLRLGDLSKVTIYINLEVNIVATVEEAVHNFYMLIMKHLSMFENLKEIVFFTCHFVAPVYLLLCISLNRYGGKIWNWCKYSYGLCSAVEHTITTPTIISVHINKEYSLLIIQICRN